MIEKNESKEKEEKMLQMNEEVKVVQHYIETVAADDRDIPRAFNGIESKTGTSEKMLHIDATKTTSQWDECEIVSEGMTPQDKVLSDAKKNVGQAAVEATMLTREGDPTAEKARQIATDRHDQEFFKSVDITPAEERVDHSAAASDELLMDTAIIRREEAYGFEVVDKHRLRTRSLAESVEVTLNSSIRVERK